jgi:hypothetical protein
MRPRRPLLAVAIAALISLGGATVTSAHTLVDPTTLTPPLLPFRVCYEDGPWVKCDTSGTDTWENEPIFDAPCGTIYETATVTSHATRWYENLLLVERNATESIRGTWSLSSTGAGPTVDIAANDGWHETFLVPGDQSSDFEVAHGNFLRIPALGADLHESGIGMTDGTAHGHLDSFTDEAIARLCELLAP